MLALSVLLVRPAVAGTRLKVVQGWASSLSHEPLFDKSIVYVKQ